MESQINIQSQFEVTPAALQKRQTYQTAANTYWLKTTRVTWIAKQSIEASYYPTLSLAASYNYIAKVLKCLGLPNRQMVFIGLISQQLV
jgi:uncharacterized lipoprotein NlpE involved in copper resistance